MSVPLAVTVLGHDRPGIIAEVTELLASLGGNLEDSTMTILRGHFAMTLLVATTEPAEQVERALAPLTADGSLVVDVPPLPDEPDDAAPGIPHLLTVHGGDRPGIVSAVTRVVADAGGNVTDLTTRLSGDLYVVVAEVDLPPSADVERLEARLREVGYRLGVGVTLRPGEPDVL